MRILRQIDTSKIEVNSKIGEYTLLPFQHYNAKVAKAVGYRLAIGDEAGLGKTVQGLHALRESGARSGKALVVSPKGLKEMWRQEIQAIPELGRVYVEHYESIKNIRPIDMDIVVFDEAHYIKSPSSQRTKAALKWIERAKHIIFLSGTLLPNRIAELYVFAYALGHISRDYYKWLDTHFGKNRWGSDDIPLPESREYMRRLYHATVVRHLKRNVVSQLPDKQVITAKIKSDSQELKDIVSRLEEMFDNADSVEQVIAQARSIKVGAGSSIGALQRYRVLAERAKIPIATEKSLDIVAEGRKVVVMSYSRSVQSQMLDLISKKTKAISITSDQTPQERIAQAERFNTDKSIRVVICSLQCASVGLNLQHDCSDMVFTAHDWTAGIMQQAEDRLHRVGQENAVMIYKWRLSKIDDRMVNAIKRKDSNLQQAIGGDEDED